MPLRLQRYYGSLARLVILWISLLIPVWETKAESEKVLTTVQNAPIKGFDPTQADDMYTALELAKVYEGLLTYHYLKRPHELVPELASSMPMVSEDGCTYTFKIKPNVYFHDDACFNSGKGREVVAEDFVYTFKRVADPKVRSPWFARFVDKIQGLDAWRDQQMGTRATNYDQEIEGIKALDRYTLQITLNKPWPQFMYMLTMGFTYVVPREAVQHYGPAFKNHPVGTGPFMLKAPFNPQLNKLVYLKNPTFRDKYFPCEASAAYQHLLVDAGKKLPFIDKIVTHILTEEQPRWLKFQQGKLDILDILGSSIALEILEQGQLIPRWQRKHVQLFLEEQQSTGFIVFNSTHDLFQDNLKLRQALSLAFDRAQYNRLFYNSTASLAQSLIPPGLAGSAAKDWINPCGEYNLDVAKKLLKEAGYPNGEGLPIITLDVTSDITCKQQGEFFKKCMAKIGVKIRVVTNIFPELLKKMGQRKTMLHMISWITDYPDAESFLALLYRADQHTGVSTHFQDDDYDRLYEEAAGLPPSSQRTLLYERLNEMAATKLPFIYMVHPVHPILYHGWVTNYVWSDFNYGVVQYLNIDLQRKRTLKALFQRGN